MQNIDTVEPIDAFDQIGHAPCALCNSSRMTTALSSPNLRPRSASGGSNKSTALIEAECKIKHYKALLRIAADKLEEAVRQANDVSARVTSAEARAAEALVKIAAAEVAHQRSEAERLQIEQELERRRAMLEDTELDLRRTQRHISRLEAENRALEMSLEKAKDSEEHYVCALRDLQARSEGNEESRMLNMKRNFIEGREEGWNEGRWFGFEEGLRKGRREGYKEGKEDGKREEREIALARFDRFLENEGRVEERTGRISKH